MCHARTLFRRSLIVILLIASPAAAEDRTADAEFAPVVKLVQAVSEAVLEHHIDPPTRQEMLLAGTKAVLKKSGQKVPPGLARRVSDLNGEEEIAAFVRKLWVPPMHNEEFRRTMVRGMLSVVPGRAAYQNAEELRVGNQLRANRYVGIGIAVTTKDKFASMAQVLPRGPAKRAGAKPRDLILSVDGQSTEGKNVRQIVQMLRGSEGTDVTLVVRQPDTKKARTLKITRGVVPIDTVEGARRLSDETWIYRAKSDVESETIAYLKIKAIRTSTLHELRKAAAILQAKHFRALILDLRFADGNDV